MEYEIRMPGSRLCLWANRIPQSESREDKWRELFPAEHGEEEEGKPEQPLPGAGPLVCLPPAVACSQPGFFKAGCSAWCEVQVTGGLGLVFSLCCSHRHAAYVADIPMVTPLVKMLELVFMLADIEKNKKKERKKEKLGPEWVLFKKEISGKGGAEWFSHRISSPSDSAMPSWRSDSKRHKTQQALYTVPFTSTSLCLDCSSWHPKDSHLKRGSLSCFSCNLWIIASEPRFKTETTNLLSSWLAFILRVCSVGLKEYDPKCQPEAEQMFFSPSSKINVCLDLLIEVVSIAPSAVCNREKELNKL